MPDIDRKGNLTGKSQEKFHRTTEDEIAQALGTLTNPYGKRQPTTTPKELQDVLGVGSSTIYNYRQEGRLPAHHFLTIAHMAFDLGDIALVEMCIPKGYAITPIEADEANGRVDDEEIAIVSNVDQARLAFEAGDHKGYKKALSAVQKEIANLAAEGLKKFGKA